MKLPVSIIIPTFNEETYLPKLLKSIHNQTLAPSEVIVVDAFSTDKTRKVAEKFGCKIVDGGMPGTARNIGARVATQPLLLFLDSDVILPQTFLEETIPEFLTRNLGVATCYVKPMSTVKIDYPLHEIVNYYMRFTRSFYPHAPGFCIFIKKGVHNNINGFDETIVMAEDHDYVRRAKKYDNFGYLTSHRIPVSVRRLKKEGRFNLAVKYMGVELHRIFLGEVKKELFSYQFGNHIRDDK